MNDNRNVTKERKIKCWIDRRRMTSRDQMQKEKDDLDVEFSPNRMMPTAD